MRKVKFVCLLLFILIAATAFLLSGNASTETDDDFDFPSVIEKKPEVSFQAYDDYNSMRIRFSYYPDDGSDFLWKNMGSEEHATKLSDEQFVNGKALIDLPFGFQLFDLIVTRVAVTKEGTIISADPSANWTIAPINAKFGMTRCNVSYLLKDKNLYVQWNNFRFNHEIFKEHEFSFQVRLGDRGEIDFVYRRVPYYFIDLRLTCACIEDKFGVMYRHQELFKIPPYKENYELGFPFDFKEYGYDYPYEIKSGIVIKFFPAHWCMGQKNCYDCTETQFTIINELTAPCSWCPAIQKCSTASDGLRHVWRENECNDVHFDHPAYCYLTLEGGSTVYYYLTAWVIVIAAIMTAGVIVIAVIICIIICIVDLLRSKFFGALFCCKKPPEVTSPDECVTLLDLTSQPNQSDDDSNAAKTQENYQIEEDDDVDESTPLIVTQV